mmetsp:Transcript_3486/g.6130  ORF Transcript_3486/g.6130 Transcript_3486/m.6130 type:complete len:94 (+) Transcript_3486:55-336(+)
MPLWCSSGAPLPIFTGRVWATRDILGAHVLHDAAAKMSHSGEAASFPLRIGPSILEAYHSLVCTEKDQSNIIAVMVLVCVPSLFGDLKDALSD